MGGGEEEEKKLLWRLERGRWAGERNLLETRLEREEGERKKLQEKLEREEEEKTRLQQLVYKGEGEMGVLERMPEETRKRLEAERWLERVIWGLISVGDGGFYVEGLSFCNRNQYKPAEL